MIDICKESVSDEYGRLPLYRLLLPTYNEHHGLLGFQEFSTLFTREMLLFQLSNNKWSVLQKYVILEVSFISKQYSL